VSAWANEGSATTFSTTDIPGQSPECNALGIFNRWFQQAGQQSRTYHPYNEIIKCGSHRQSGTTESLNDDEGHAMNVHDAIAGRNERTCGHQNTCQATTTCSAGRHAYGWPPLALRSGLTSWWLHQHH
jgi:hypothetical protein